MCASTVSSTIAEIPFLPPNLSKSVVSMLLKYGFICQK
jgi:hypothetical protein